MVDAATDATFRGISAMTTKITATMAMSNSLRNVLTESPTTCA